MASTIGRAGKHLFLKSPGNLKRVGSVASRNFAEDDDDEEGVFSDGACGNCDDASKAGQLLHSNSHKSFSSKGEEDSGKLQGSSKLMGSGKSIFNPDSSTSPSNYDDGQEYEFATTTSSRTLELKKSNASMQKPDHKDLSRMSTSTTVNSSGKHSHQDEEKVEEPRSPTELELKRNWEEEQRRAQKEKEDLLAELEVMRMQNKLLTNRIEKTQQESINQLEQERHERELEVFRLEQDKLQLNRQLREAQAETERRLAAEKDALMATLKKMEAEKGELLNKVKTTEELVTNEAGLMEMQKAEFEAQLKKLEADKVSLAKKVEENHQKAEEANDSNAKELEDERNELQMVLEVVEQQKNALAATLCETEQKALEQAAKLSQQLEDEKKQMSERLDKLERERKELAEKVTASEELAKAQALEIGQQLEEQKARAVAAMAQLEEEKLKVKQQITENDSKSKSVVDLEQIKAERIALDEKLRSMERDKQLLEERLQMTEAASKEREDTMVKQMAREKEDLMKTVQKMKKDLLADREKNNKRNSSSGSTLNNTSFRSTGEGSLALPLRSNRSLFDLMGESRDSVQSLGSSSYEIVATLSKGTSFRPVGNLNPMHKASVYHPVEKIVEGDENFMDLSSDEEDEEGFKGPPREKSFAKAKVEDPLEVSMGDESVQNITNLDALDEDLFADLPAPHASAARGDMKRLQLLEELDPDLLISLDNGGRKPLFYAAAYGREEAVKYLVSLFPSTVMDGDIHGDTALHAATASGNAKCAELLVQESGEIADPHNHLEMTPAHLASTAECLEVLYKYGADMATLDSNGRSPLFIACAMNREECAEYLIGCLDEIEGALLAQDSRGDSPLHAAACNGSADCLLLLLSYGIDPRSANTQNLKAIDLAVRNGHKKCREILAEYHLHYCTSSEFDSVLFLATLEGHRALAVEKGEKRHEEECTYQIVRKDSVSSAAPPTVIMDHGLAGKAQSMFSLRNEKSLRLQRWGHWITYHDQVTDTQYWYNHETQTGQWEIPEEVQQLQVNSIKTGYDRVLQSKMSMKLKRLNAEWLSYVPESGRTFFYNDKNGNFQWENPLGDHNVISNSNDTNDKKNAIASFNDKFDEPIDPNHEWKAYEDPESGAVFWYNHVSKVSQWECPFEVDNNGNRRRRRNSFDSVDENDIYNVGDHETDLDI